MTDKEHNLRRMEIDHTALDISLYEERDQPPVTPMFVMAVDKLTGQAVRCWLEWPEQLPVEATSFGALVQAAREALHLPLEEVARRIMKTDQRELSVEYLKAIERGNRLPSSTLIPQFAKALQIPEEVLYFSRGCLPPDLLPQGQPFGRIVRAFQAFRAELAAETNPRNEADVLAC